jgi:hypothetical protein
VFRTTVGDRRGCDESEELLESKQLHALQNSKSKARGVEVIFYCEGTQRGATVARRLWRVESYVYAPLRFVPRQLRVVLCQLIAGSEERACIDRTVSSKYACTIIGISAG